MTILFIGNAHSFESIDFYTKKYKLSQVYPQQNFDFTIVEGLSNYEKIIVLSIPPVPSFPKSNCLFSTYKIEKISNNLTILHLPMINLPIIKNLIMMFVILISAIFYSIIYFKQRKRIIIGYLLSYITIPIILIRYFFNIEITLIVPDLPELLYKYDLNISRFRSTLMSISLIFEKMLRSSFDNYIFISEQMNSIINKYNKPYIVFEGAIRVQDFLNSNNKRDEIKKTQKVLYAGTLHKKFGIENLITGFLNIENRNIELHLYGVGDFVPKIKEYMIKNKNIFYHSPVSWKEILEVERESSLLVIPRPLSEEYTKYSFPSKILEYLASGTPIISTRLPGIPKEYDSFLNYFDSDSSLDIRRGLDRMLKLDEIERKRIGDRAKAFVFESKNNVTYTSKIYRLINNQ